MAVLIVDQVVVEVLGRSGGGGGGGGTPSLPLNSVQFNDASAFGGSATLLTDGSYLILGDGTAIGTYAAAFGKTTAATGNYSHAEGRSSQAVGNVSHAEGYKTYANAPYSHSEGYYTQANGYYSHAEGKFSYANDRGSHAEGRSTANGMYSHAEGRYTIAQRDECHAEGYSTEAYGYYSHSEGVYTIAHGNMSHAEGRRTRADGFIAHVEGHECWACQGYSHAEGYYSTAIGYYSHAEGNYTYSVGLHSHAEGRRTHTGRKPRQFTVSGTTVTIYGYNAVEEFPDGQSVAFFRLTGGTNEAMFTETRTTSAVTFSGGNTYFTISSPLDDRTNGRCANLSFGRSAHAEGERTEASGNYSHAEGYYTFARGNYSHAEGRYTYAYGDKCHTEGQGTRTYGTYSHAEGISSIARGYGNHAEGFFALAYGRYCHAEGAINIASGQYSHAEGTQTLAAGDGSHSEGFGLYPSSVRSVARGSHAEGRNTVASGNYSHAEGELSRAGNPIRSFTVSGTTVTISGDVTSEFTNTDTVNFFSLTGGTANTVFAAERSISGVAYGAGNTTFTISSVLSDRTAGSCVDIMKARWTHAEGETTVASANYAHSEGSDTIASGVASHAEGDGCTASGTASHAEGFSNIVSCHSGHVEGRANNCLGTGYSHVEGIYNTASGSFACHVEGQRNTASGNVSHAEGFYNTASGTYSHAGGNRAVANIRAQFARGGGRFAADGDAQHAIASVMILTTNAVATEMTVNGLAAGATNRLFLPSNRAWGCIVNITAARVTGTDFATFTRYLMIQNTGGTTAIVGAVQTIGTDIGSNAGSPPVGWAVTLTADDPNDSLKIEATGAAATNIRWVARVEMTQVGF